jgi:hypothetical protein
VLASSVREVRIEGGGQGVSFLVKRQEVVGGDHDVDVERSQAVCGLAGGRLGLDVAAEPEDDGFPIGVARPRGVAVSGGGQGVRDALRNRQRHDEVIETRLGERDVKPEEAPLRAQCGDALARGGVEPVEDVGHGVRTRGGPPRGGGRAGRLGEF